MNEKELSQLYFLEKEIEEYQQQILKLETLATKCTSTISDMPHETGITDRDGSPFLFKLLKWLLLFMVVL